MSKRKREETNIIESPPPPTEQVVDANLNKFMKQDLPVNATRIAPTVDPEFEEEDPDVDVNAPVTDMTRNRIIYYLSKGIDQTGAPALIKHFNEIGRLSEANAREWLKALSYINSRNIDDTIVENAIENVCGLTMNPHDTICHEKAKKDPYIKECVATGLNDLLGQIGPFAGIVVYAFYCLNSWSGKNLEPENVPETNQNSIIVSKTIETKQTTKS